MSTPHKKVAVSRASREALLRYAVNALNIDDLSESITREDLLKRMYDWGLSASNPIPELPEVSKTVAPQTSSADFQLNNDDRRSGDDQRWICVYVMNDNATPGEKRTSIIQFPVWISLNGDAVLLQRGKKSWIREPLYWVLHDAVMVEWEQTEAQRHDVGDGTETINKKGTPRPVHSYPHNVVKVGGKVKDGLPPVLDDEVLITPAGMVNNRVETAPQLEPVVGAR